jgi:murein L,D-transpeptidase YafK
MRTGTPLVVALLLLASPSLAPAGDFADRQHRFPRVRAAESAHAETVRRWFRDAEAAWPPRILLRSFKQDGALQMWAAPRAGDRWVLVRSFPVCAQSGVIGPKHRQGDLQVPEGFYRIDRFNPSSRFHLSLGLNYPNRFDRARARRAGVRDPGGDIFVHGDCVTIGCLPIRDAPMSRLYLAAVAARDAGQRRIPVHVFPCRFGEAACEAALAGHPEHTALWAELRDGYWLFESTRRPPRVRVTDHGYRIRAAPGS